MKRRGTLRRKTLETNIVAEVVLDGAGRANVKTGIPFLDHMLTALAKHGYFDLKVKARGDLEVDIHHTNEDVAIALGMAFKKALNEKKGIRRFADFRAPLDESLAGARVSLDFSGRGSLHVHTSAKTRWISNPALAASPNKRGYTVLDMKHFFESFATNAGVTLHLDLISGEHPHHLIEASFKALAKALDWATQVDPRGRRSVPSTKGTL